MSSLFFIYYGFCVFTNNLSIDLIKASSDVTTLSTPSEKPGSNGAPDAATESPVVLAIAVDTAPPAVIAILTLAIETLKGGVVSATGGNPIGGGSNILFN